MLLFLFVCGRPSLVFADQVGGGFAQPAANVAPAPSFVDWLQDGEVTITVETDVDKLKRERHLQDYQPAVIRVKNGNAVLEEEAKVKPRGNFRCNLCDIPPIKMKIPKKEMLKAGFQEWNEFKLVFPCKRGKAYEQYVLKEYLTYRLYNLLTDRSYRVRFVNLELDNTNEGRDRNHDKVAFLIEHTEELENRLGGKEVKSRSISPAMLVQEDYTRMQVFQYMVGNTDWLPVTAHNLEMIELNDGTLIPVPFDFDFSGIVNSRYAKPNSKTGLSDVTLRFFMGNEKTREDLEPVFAEFRAKKDAMINMIAHFEPLDFRERKRMIRYLQTFFRIIDNERLVRKVFIENPPFEAPMY